MQLFREQRHTICVMKQHDYKQKEIALAIGSDKCI